MAEDPRIEQIRVVLANHTDPFSIYGHQGRGLERIRAIVDSAPPAPRVFLPGDVVPAGLWVSYRTPMGLAAAMSAEDWMAMDGAVVELDLPSLADWQATVDRTSADRREREQAHLTVLKAALGADVAREHGVLPDEDEDVKESTSNTEHADDCQGCDGPGIVPCAADRVIGNTAYRNGQPIKDLEAGRG